MFVCRGAAFEMFGAAPCCIFAQSVCFAWCAVDTKRRHCHNSQRTCAWGCGSVGRALPSHGRGRGFESPHLHHPNVMTAGSRSRAGSFFVWGGRARGLLASQGENCSITMSKCLVACILGCSIRINLPLMKNVPKRLWRHMIMNGPMDRYRASLAATPGPVSLSECPQVKMDLKGMMAYVKSQGVQPSELSSEDKARYVSSWGGLSH